LTALVLTKNNNKEKHAKKKQIDANYEQVPQRWQRDHASSAI